LLSSKSGPREGVVGVVVWFDGFVVALKNRFVLGEDASVLSRLWNIELVHGVERVVCNDRERLID
jgi:hypothetical protein